MKTSKEPQRAWLYARVPGNYIETKNTLNVLMLQAQRDGAEVVGWGYDLAGNLLQDELSMVDFIQCKHGLFPLCLTIVGPDPGLPDRAGPRRCGQDTDMSIVEIC